MNGKPAIGLGIAMREGGDILALGPNIEQAMHRSPAIADRHHLEPGRRWPAWSTTRSAISPPRSAAIAIIMAELRQSQHARRQIGTVDPLTLAVVFPIMQFRDRPARIRWGR